MDVATVRMPYLAMRATLFIKEALCLASCLVDIRSIVWSIVTIVNVDKHCSALSQVSIPKALKFL